jgi:hypothetical protein
VRIWIRLAARLYPTGWRERSGAEFDALLEAASPGWRDLSDVLRGALGMHMETWSFRKTAVARGRAGAVLAAGVASRMPDRHVSTAVIGVGLADRKAALGEHLNPVLRQALSCRSLAEAIRKEDLYPTDRRRTPLEDVIERMRHDIRVATLDSRAGEPSRFAAQYVYRNPAQARETTREPIAKLMEANGMANRAATATERQSAALNLEVLDAASPPRTSASPNRPMITALGIGAGLLPAALAAVALRLRRRAVRT